MTSLMVPFFTMSSRKGLGHLSPPLHECPLMAPPAHHTMLLPCVLADSPCGGAEMSIGDAWAMEADDQSYIESMTGASCACSRMNFLRALLALP